MVSNMLKIKHCPIITLLLVLVLVIFEIFNKNKINRIKFRKYCNIDFEKDTYHSVVKKFITTHFIHAGNTLGHFIPNIILTLIFGILLEGLVGSIKMFLYLIICIFIYWVLVYSIIGPYRKGCGFSSIYFSFVSIYCSINILKNPSIYYKLLYATCPMIFLYITNLFGNLVKAQGHSSNYVHLLSIIYGYIIGIVEGFVELVK